MKEEGRLMTFSDFVENVVETPICCELKQRLDKWYEFYTKDHEKCVFYLKLSRGLAKSDLLILLPLLLEMYTRMESEVGEE